MMRLTLVSTAVCSSRSVATMFVSASAAGSATERRTSICAA